MWLRFDYRLSESSISQPFLRSGHSFQGENDDNGPLISVPSITIKKEHKEGISHMAAPYTGSRKLKQGQTLVMHLLSCF